MISVGRLQTVEGGSAVKRQVLCHHKVIKEVIHEESEVQFTFVGKASHQRPEVGPLSMKRSAIGVPYPHRCF
jgi:hypothetical protein